MRDTESTENRDILAELEEQQALEKSLLEIEERVQNIPLTHVVIQLSLAWAALGAAGLAAGGYFFGLAGLLIGLLAPGGLIFLVWIARDVVMRRQ